MDHYTAICKFHPTSLPETFNFGRDVVDDMAQNVNKIALITHPAVQESAVVGLPDPERGEIVKAFVVLTQSGSQRTDSTLVTELQTHVKRTTAPYKYPRAIEFVDELPKTVSGKIQRNLLRQSTPS